MQSVPETRPIPATSPPEGTTSSYRSQPASGASSRNGEPGSSSRSTRSRTSSLPRRTCRARDASSPPSRTSASRSRSSSARSFRCGPGRRPSVISAPLTAKNLREPSDRRLAIVNKTVYHRGMDPAISSAIEAAQPLPAVPPAAARRGRREQILAAAAELFASRGFHGVSIDDLGAAVGISGPAIYRHFPSKEAMLRDMLVGISERLLSEGRRRVKQATGPDAALRALVG